MSLLEQPGNPPGLHQPARPFRSELGQTALEYALVVGVVCVGLAAVLIGFGDFVIDTIWERLGVT